MERGGYPLDLESLLGFATPSLANCPVNAVSPVTANRGWYVRLRSGATISKIGYHVSNSVGNISLAAYRNSGLGRSAVPATRLATTGAIACPANGYRESALGATVTVYPGDWLFLSADDVTATFWNACSTGGDSNLFLGMNYYQAAAHPAPSPAGTLVASNVRVPILIGIP